MRKTYNIFSLCREIGNKYVSFEGHSCFGCSTARIFDTIARMVDFLQREEAAKSCNFEAELNNGMGTKVLLTIELLNNNVYKDSAFSLVESRI